MDRMDNKDMMHTKRQTIIVTIKYFHSVITSRQIVAKFLLLTDKKQVKISHKK